MERISQGHYDTREPIRSTFQDGLWRIFPACHDALPQRMKQAVQQLAQNDEPPSRHL
jgi:hypothetical protein